MDIISTPKIIDTQPVSLARFRGRRLGRKIAKLLFELNKQRIDDQKETPNFPSGGWVSGSCPPDIDMLPRQFNLSGESVFRMDYVPGTSNGIPYRE